MQKNITINEQNLYRSFSIFERSYRVLNEIGQKGFQLNQSAQDHDPEAISILASQMITATMLQGFAIEIGLKCILVKNAKITSGHALQDLFNGIPVDLKNEIRSSVCSSINISSPEFDSLLLKNSKVFVDWRYFYEKDNLDSDIEFLRHLLDSLKIILKRILVV